MIARMWIFQENPNDLSWDEYGVPLGAEVFPAVVYRACPDDHENWVEKPSSCIMMFPGDYRKARRIPGGDGDDR